MNAGALPPLIEQMLRPAFYPHPVAGDSVRLVQTHISWVLLTGPFAYKVKKPVSFGFLDSSTLERRKRFCEEELRLNRRGAAGLYLEVLPITRSADGGFHLGGEGEVVEYTVKMRQFREEALFSRLLERGQLGEPEVVELGRTLARFHAAAPTSSEVSRFGEPGAVKRLIDENYRQSEHHAAPGGPQTPRQLEETRAFTDRFFAARQDLLGARVRGGFVRECHGDLHLSNICLLDDPPGPRVLLFDCIEFNDGFRCVDVMYDLAFPVMDLEARGRPDLANALLNTYAERTGDWEGLRVLPLYLCRQAYVRGKVIGLLADELAAEGDDAGRVGAAESSARYYRLAWEWAQRFGRPRPGRLLLMSGVSGSGKSTVARLLARRLGAVQVRADAVRKHLAGLPLDEPGGEGLYTAEMTRRTYDRLLELGLMLSAEGYPVVLDAKYDRRAARQAVLAAAGSKGLEVRIVHCTAPPEVLRQRLMGRHGDVSDATADLLERQLEVWEAFDDGERGWATTMDTSDDVAEQVQRLCGSLGESGPL